MLPHLGEIPRSNFHFDFEFERNVLTEAVKENPNWGRLGIDNAPPKANETTSSYGSASDPVVSKYIAAGLSREVVPLAVANYGDNPSKVRKMDICRIEIKDEPRSIKTSGYESTMKNTDVLHCLFLSI